MANEASPLNKPLIVFTLLVVVLMEANQQTQPTYRSNKEAAAMAGILILLSAFGRLDSGTLEYSSSARYRLARDYSLGSGGAFSGGIVSVVKCLLCCRGNGDLRRRPER